MHDDQLYEEEQRQNASGPEAGQGLYKYDHLLQGRESQAITGAFLLGLGLGLMLRRRSHHREFLGQTVLITGGSRGLGLQLAREFADRGAEVVFCARHADEVGRAEEILSAEGYTNVKGMVADIARPDGPLDLVERIAREVGPVSILVNNAGTIQVQPFVDSQEQAFHQSLDLFLYGPLRLCREVLPSMMSEGDGTIVNITSLGGQVPAPHLVPYNCGKAAMVAMSEGMGVELDRYGINVLTVKPGLMRTGSHRNATFGGHSSQEYAWFSRAAVNPALSLNTATAARSVVDAVLARRRTLSLGWEARWAPFVHSMFPEASQRMASAIEKLLPNPGTEQPMMGEIVAPEAPPLSSLLKRLERKAMEKHQAARYAMKAQSNGNSR
jgi:short-subunit dehydrogenase